MEIIVIVAVAALVFLWFRGKAEGRSIKQAVKIGWVKSKPDKLAAAGGTEAEVANAVARAKGKEAKRVRRQEARSAAEAKPILNSKIVSNEKLGSISMNGKGGLKFYRSTYPVAGARAECQGGSQKSRMTATRVLGGAALAGGVGALVGGMARKDKTRVYLVIELENGRVLTQDFPATQEQAVRTFAGNVSFAGRYWAEKAAV